MVHGDVILSSRDIAVYQSPGSRVEGRITTNIAPFAILTAIKVLLLCCVLPIVFLVVLILGLGVLLGRASKRRPQAAQASVPVVEDDIQTKLQKLKALLDQSLITETDHEAKKADILSKM